MTNRDTPRPRARFVLERVLPLAAGGVFGAVVFVADVPLWAKLLALVGLGVGVFAWTAVRELRIHLRVRQYGALGDPDAILELTDAELARRRSARSKLPFLIYRANAMQMKGCFEDALELLGLAAPSAASGKARRQWEFLHAHSLLGALLHTGHIGQARELMAGRIEPMSRNMPAPIGPIAWEEATARLSFFTGRLGDSRERFDELADDDRIPPSSRGLYHHYLARIAEKQDRAEDAARHHREAARLAPRTFVAEEA